MLIEKLDFNIPKNLTALYQEEPRDKSKFVVSQKNKLSIIQEFKEWDEESILNEQNIWTLPDLTSTERFKNFYRSIKKK